MIDKSKFTDAINNVLETEARVSATLLPGVLEPGSDDSSPQSYLIRHRIESVRRVWVSADIDARALVCMLAEDYEAAKTWSRHLAQVMRRDELVLSELAPQGIDAARVRATPPLPSTVAMVETLLPALGVLGSLPAVACAVFVEWNAARAATKDEARKVFGAKLVAGAAAHPKLDKHEARVEQMIELARRLSSGRPDGVAHFVALLRLISAFSRAYLTELQAFAAFELDPTKAPSARASAPQR